jgi:hypothetical protein
LHLFFRKAQFTPPLGHLDPFRVFKAKLKELKRRLLKKDILEKVWAHVYIVELQKRGLPHAHFLLIM